MPVGCLQKHTASCSERVSHGGDLLLGTRRVITPLQMKPTCTTLTYFTPARGQAGEKPLDPVTAGSDGRDIAGLGFPDPARVPGQSSPRHGSRRGFESEAGDNVSRRASGRKVRFQWRSETWEVEHQRLGDLI